MMLAVSKLLAAALVLSVIEESLSFSVTVPIVNFRGAFNRASGSAITPRAKREKHSSGQLSMSESSDSNNAVSFMLQAVQGDEMVGMVSDNGEVSFRAVTATGLVKGATAMQGTSPVASAALGRAMVCALLLSQGKKEGEMYGEAGRETVQIDIRGDGPLKQVFALADGRAEVRGYVAEPLVHLPPNARGKLDVARAVGKGFLTVVRNNVLWKQPYTGITQIVSGEIPEDIAHYLTESEQTPSAIGAGVLVATETEQVVAAGGWLVQMLPGATEETVSAVERNIASLQKTPTELVRSGKSALDICTLLSDGLREQELIPTYQVRPRFTCKCSMEKVYRTVALMPRGEMDAILQEKGKLEVKCEFCKRCYSLGGRELTEAYEAASASSDPGTDSP